MTDTPALLELRELRKSFRNDLLKQNQIALDGISYAFSNGKCTGLLGHNGAGKTTAIRSILGIVFPDAGEILYQGHKITTPDRRQVGYMPEVNKLPLNLTPDEILRHQVRVMGMSHHLGRQGVNERIKDALEQVQLFPHRFKKIRQLSKGMGRKIAWLQATIHAPQILILDEPFTGLDPVARRQLETWIKAEKERGTTIIMCTHELWTVRSLCDEFVILNKGRIVFSTKPLPSDTGAANISQVADLRSANNVYVSGVDGEQLQTIGRNHGLLPWQVIRQDGHLTILSFAEYGDAVSWLKALIECGVVVMRFGDESFIDEEELLKYFSGELH